MSEWEANRLTVKGKCVWCERTAYRTVKIGTKVNIPEGRLDEERVPVCARDYARFNANGTFELTKDAPRSISNDRLQQARLMRKAGKSYEAIAKYLGVSKTLARIRVLHGYSMRRRGRPHGRASRKRKA